MKCFDKTSRSVSTEVFLRSPFWFYISMIKDGGITIMQNDYCTEHFDTTGWFLVISLARNKTHILQILRETGGIHSSFFFSRSMLLKESTVQSRKRSTYSWGLFKSTGFLRRSEKFWKVWSRCSWFQGFGRMIKLQEMRWNTFSFRSIKLLFVQEPWIFTNVFTAVGKNKNKKKTHLPGDPTLTFTLLLMA